MTSSRQKKTAETCRKGAIILFWLALWQTAAVLIGNNIIFVGPLDTAETLLLLLPTQEFWLSLGHSVFRITAGFLMAFFLGAAAGIASFFLPVLKEFLAPPVLLMKSIPVASFVILALIWIGSENLSVFISFMVVFPMIYESALTGLGEADLALLEMAQVFHLSAFRKFFAVYLPALLPYLAGSCRFALAMGMKSGAAAEVIGLPEFSIGEQLYTSKIYLETAGLFAWTAVIIAVTAFLERLFLLLMNCLLKMQGK